MPSEFVASFTRPLLASPPPTPPNACADPFKHGLIRVYADALDMYLSQALHAEAEAEYWARVEGSTVALCVYYLYTLGQRLPPNPLSFVNLKQEIKSKRKTLEKIRDERAATLGSLVHLRRSEHLHTPILPLQSTLLTLPSTHARLLQSQHLLRPPWHIRHLPSLLLLPPLTLYVYTLVKPHLQHVLATTTSTLTGFITNWLVDPILSILQTIRSGSSASSTLVHDQTVQADLESLEQMSISLLRSGSPVALTPDQLSHISSQILITRDITPVLQIHTSASSKPLSSLLLPPNTLLHTLLIQLQKAKVDLDFALQGISHLLKSQQLTFGFVGIAPAFGLVYLVWGAGTGLWRGTAGWGRWGGKTRRRVVWARLRRIERILNASVPAVDDASLLAPLPTGLMILSLTKLRAYASTYLPTRIREPFMEDLADLEDPALDARGKLRVVDRMWRSWAGGMGHEGVIVNP